MTANDRRRRASLGRGRLVAGARRVPWAGVLGGGRTRTPTEGAEPPVEAMACDGSEAHGRRSRDGSGRAGNRTSCRKSLEICNFLKHVSLFIRNDSHFVTRIKSRRRPLGEPVGAIFWSPPGANTVHRQTDCPAVPGRRGASRGGIAAADGRGCEPGGGTRAFAAVADPGRGGVPLILLPKVPVGFAGNLSVSYGIP